MQYVKVFYYLHSLVFDAPQILPRQPLDNRRLLCPRLLFTNSPGKITFFLAMWPVLVTTTAVKLSVGY
jgi:hypothetical protein